MCTLIALLAQRMKTIEFFSKSNSARSGTDDRSRSEYLHSAFVDINHLLKYKVGYPK